MRLRVERGEPAVRERENRAVAAALLGQQRRRLLGREEGLGGQVLLAPHPDGARRRVALEARVRLRRQQPATAQQANAAVGQPRTQRPVDLGVGGQESRAQVDRGEEGPRGAQLAGRVHGRAEEAADGRDEQERADDVLRGR